MGNAPIWKGKEKRAPFEIKYLTDAPVEDAPAKYEVRWPDFTTFFITLFLK